ncbi:MAG: hypothetical protein C0596_17985 [Marinilabiliales bacterium]|nr:MAG: hypothetical protein C0596_17985 [Marinilabiliales bacterium]
MLTVKKIIKYKLWISSVIAIIVGLILLPIALLFVNIQEENPYDNEYYKSSTIKVPKGIYIKEANKVFYDFLVDIKNTDGVLVLGTSETSNWFSGKNYYSLLNKDISINRGFYTIAGAGRNANMYFPLILNNPEAFKGLEIIYYINPTYWREDLSKFDNQYFQRYVDFNIVLNTKALAKEKDIYRNFMILSPEYYIGALSEKIITDYRDLFRENLNYLISGSENKNAEQTIVIKQKHSSKNKIKIEDYYTDEDLLKEQNKINLKYNVTDKYLANNEEFPEIDKESTYHYDLLLAFIGLCKEYDIKCVFYLGPFN